MFIRKLEIFSVKKNKIIRKINFHIGVNLIVDNTPIESDKGTGNNVGKTTVLKLIDYALGSDPKKIYTDEESKKTIEIVKNYLINNEVLITLNLARNLNDPPTNDIIIKKNFLGYKKKIFEINGENYNDTDFEKQLDYLFLGDRGSDKPTLKQILSHNIRYTDFRISNTLRMVNQYTSLPEYEQLFLYMLGISIPERAKILKKLNTEMKFKERLTKNQDKTELDLQSRQIKRTIDGLNAEKAALNINENYEKDLDELNTVKYQIGRLSSEITELSLRKKLIIETKEEMISNTSNINVNLLKDIYKQAKVNISEIEKKFEELVEYHNTMIMERIRFVIEDLPEIEGQLSESRKNLEILTRDEALLAKKIKSSNTYFDLERIIAELNTNNQKLGEIKKQLSQISEVDNIIVELNSELKQIDEGIYSEEFQERLTNQIDKFNSYFSKVSKELYGEEYGITFEVDKDKKTGKNVYSFKSFNNNSSSGKKQGEIICFDIAYTLFARDNQIPHGSFILNDKKELMHGNQLTKVAKYAKENNIQLIFSILKDKLPVELNSSDNIIIELSQEEKLFKIENDEKK